MNSISNIYSNYASAVYQKSNAKTSKTEDYKTNENTKAEKTDSTEKSSKADYGKTIGKPKLSEKAAKYYEELKSKYKNLDFILVSEDEKENAKANAGSYANASKTVVLIDEDKIEKMASDEKYRKQYEGIISNAATGVSALKSKMEANGMSAGIKGFGAQVNDNGTLSYFAVVDKSLASQKDRIAKKAAEKKAEKKEGAKKDAKEKLVEKRAEKADETSKSDSASKVDDSDNDDSDNTMTITASSWEDLYSQLEALGLPKSTTGFTSSASESYAGVGIDVKG